MQTGRQVGVWREQGPMEVTAGKEGRLHGRKFKAKDLIAAVFPDSLF